MNDTRSQPQRIIVGVDGSEGSKHALRWAARLATAFGVGIDAVAAYEAVSAYGWSALPPLYSPHSDVDKQLNDVVDEVFGTDRPADLRLRVLEGPPAARLVTASKGELMLVVGRRGRGGFTALRLGSVSAKVTEHATCPVFVVNEHADLPAAP